MPMYTYVHLCLATTNIPRKSLAVAALQLPPEISPAAVALLSILHLGYTVGKGGYCQHSFRARNPLPPLKLKSLMSLSFLALKHNLTKNRGRGIGGTTKLTKKPIPAPILAQQDIIAILPREPRPSRSRSSLLTDQMRVLKMASPTTSR